MSVKWPIKLTAELLTPTLTIKIKKIKYLHVQQGQSISFSLKYNYYHTTLIAILFLSSVFFSIGSYIRNSLLIELFSNSLSLIKSAK